MPDLWQRLTQALWVADKHNSPRGLWIHRAKASWNHLDVEEHLAAHFDERWWHNTPPFPAPNNSDPCLELFVAADADDDRASWAVVDRHDCYGSTCSSRMWGAQTLHRAQLGGIYAAVCLAPPDTPLHIFSRSRAAVSAAQSALDGKPRQPDSPADALLTALTRRIQARTAPTLLHWTQERSRSTEPTGAAEQQALRALGLPPVRPPRELATTRWTLNGQPLDRDWLDTIHAHLHDQRLTSMASNQRSGEFYPQCHQPSSWRPAWLDPTARTFAFKARGHALPTAKRALDYFPRPFGRPIALQCALCNAPDTATHWYGCTKLADEWAVALAPLDRLHELNSTSWIALQPCEHLAQGLVPASLPIKKRSQLASAAVNAAHTVWTARKALWARVKHAREPAAWVCQQHTARSAGSLSRTDATRRDTACWQW